MVYDQLTSSQLLNRPVVLQRLNKKSIKDGSRTLQWLSRVFYGKKYFSDRIKHRNKTFWAEEGADKLKTTPRYAHDPFSKWKGSTHWQRRLSNKRNAHEFALKHNCRVPDLYWQGSDCSTIDFSKLPHHYVIKPTIGHSCGMVYLMSRGTNLFDMRHYTSAELVAGMEKAIDERPGLEFMIVEFCRNERGEYQIPDDYKIMCFNGQIACICLVNRFSSKKGYHNFYDENWHQLKQINTLYPMAGFQRAPACLHEMLEQAKTLSQAYEIFVRIDFYATDKGAVFGEFTPTPSLGTGFTPYAENLFTAYWDVFCTNLI